MEAWSNLTFGATLGGMVIGSAGVTLAHGMEHPVSGRVNAVHGQGLAALTPAAINALYKYNRVKFGTLARHFGGMTAEDLSGKIVSLLSRLDLSCTLTDLGIRKEDLDWLTDNCIKVSAGNLANTPGQVTREEIRSIYEAAL